MIKKLKELTNGQIKKICNKYIAQEKSCLNCPFRRFRYDSKGNEKELFCYPVLKSIGYELREDIKEEEYNILDEDL